MRTARRQTALWLALLWTALAAVAFLLPGYLLPDPERDIASRMIHVAAFAGGAWFWLRAFPERWGRVAAAGLALIVASEVLQACVIPGRGAQWLDAGADLLGLALGMMLAMARRAAADRERPA